MLSDKGAQILLLLKNDKGDESKDFDTMSHLQRQGYIELRAGRISDISPLGEEALADYLNNQEIRQTAIEANKKAQRANIISVISLFIAFVIPIITALIKS